MNQDIQNAIDEFERETTKQEIKAQELTFDELTPEESAELMSLCKLSDSLINQAI